MEKKPYKENETFLHHQQVETGKKNRNLLWKRMKRKTYRVFGKKFTYFTCFKFKKFQSYEFF